MTHPDRRIAPAIHPFGRLILPPERLTVLASGARLHVIADDGCPLVRLCIIGRGGRLESSSQASAILSAELLPEGSLRFDAEKTADIIDFHGAAVSGRCSDHHTRLDLTCLPSAMAELLPVFEALTYCPAFTDNRLEATRAMLASQCAYERERVINLAGEACFGLIAGRGHIATRVPRPEDYDGIEADEVKSSISRIFTASNVDVFVCGNVSRELEASVTDMIERMRPGTSLHLAVNPYTPEAPQTLYIEKPGAQQSAVSVMIPAVPRQHPDYLPLRIAVTALGGFFGSRLMQNIREDKGLTYGISASLNGTQEGSYVEISAQCAPAYTGSLLRELRSELLRMASAPLSADELLRVRLYEQTRIASMLDNAIASGDQYITQLVVGLPDDYFSKQERITANITAEEIADVAGRYLIPDNMRIAIAG